MANHNNTIWNNPKNKQRPRKKLKGSTTTSIPIRNQLPPDQQVVQPQRRIAFHARLKRRYLGKVRLTRRCCHNKKSYNKSLGIRQKWKIIIYYVD